MLVLTRKVNEAVTIKNPESGEDVMVVRLLSVEGGRVRLGFEASPAVFQIVRNELLERYGADFGRKPLAR